jgi:hypothetical protein
VLRVAAEFENVPLRNPHVLEQTPGAEGQPGGLGAPQFVWQAGNRLLEIKVRTAASQQVQEMFAQR